MQITVLSVATFDTLLFFELTVHGLCRITYPSTCGGDRSVEAPRPPLFSVLPHPLPPRYFFKASGLKPKKGYRGCSKGQGGGCYQHFCETVVTAGQHKWGCTHIRPLHLDQWQVPALPLTVVWPGSCHFPYGNICTLGDLQLLPPKDGM